MDFLKRQHFFYTKCVVLSRIICLSPTILVVWSVGFLHLHKIANICHGYAGPTC